jgi:hypothetical protein
MTLLEDITSGKYNNYLIAIIFVIIFLIVTKKSKEDFTAITSLSDQQQNDIKQLIYETYRIDVNAIKNLSTVATQLQNGGLTYPGDFKVQGKLNIDNDTTCNKLTANGDTMLNKLTANGDTTLTKLTVNGDTTLNGNTTLNKLTTNVDIIGSNVKLNELQFNQMSLNNDLLFDLLNTQTGTFTNAVVQGDRNINIGNCNDSTVFPRTFTVTFPIPYRTRIPKVLLSLYKADADFDRNLRYEFKNINVTLTTLSFDMFIWCNTQFSGYNIGWMATV